MNTLATERRARIEELLTENKSVLVTELAQLFEVTPETIRASYSIPTAFRFFKKKMLEEA